MMHKKLFPDCQRRRVIGVGFQYCCVAPEGTAKGRAILDSDPNNPDQRIGVSQTEKTGKTGFDLSHIIQAPISTALAAMNAVIQPLSEVNQRARNILIQELGAVDAMRFLNQFQIGSDDYTAERAQLFKDDTVKSIVAGIRAQQS